MRQFIVLLAAGVVTVLMIMGCGTEPGGPMDDSYDDSGGRVDDIGREIPRTLSCEAPACSGDECCEGNSTCERKCKDNFSGKSKTACEKLPINTVNKLAIMFDKTLKTANQSNLDNFTAEDYNLLCMVLETWDDFAVWKNLALKYRAEPAKRIMQWIIDNNQATEIVLKILKKDDPIDMLKIIIGAMGGDSSQNPRAQALVDGLSRSIDSSNRSTLAYAQNNSNYELIRIIHDNIINEDGQFCDSTSNQPQKSGTSTNYGKEACMLDVYCRAIDKDGASDRADLAEHVDSAEMKDFITADTASDGLSGSGADSLSESDGSDWSNKACKRLYTDYTSTFLPATPTPSY